MGEGGRYQQHPGRRAEDRLPEEHRPRYSTADAHSLIAAAVREALEARESEPTQRVSVPPPPHHRASDDVRDLRAMRGWWTTTAKILTGLALVGTVIGMGYAGCSVVRSEVDRSITAQVAPVRQDVAEIQRDMREVLRRLPTKERSR